MSWSASGHLDKSEMHILCRRFRRSDVRKRACGQRGVRLSLRTCRLGINRSSKEAAVTISSLKPGTRNHRARLDERGLARFTVLGLDTDRDLIRALARRLAEAGPDAERLRAIINQGIASGRRRKAKSLLLSAGRRLLAPISTCRVRGILCRQQNKSTSLENDLRVAKWGKSLAIRLPAAVVAALGLREGDEIEIHVIDGQERAVARKASRSELLSRLRAFRGRLPPDFKFDRDEVNAR